MLDFDTMLTHVGEFGIYQKMLFILQAPFCIFVTFVTFGQIFMQIYPTQFWCGDHLDCNFGNLTLGQRQNLSLPFIVSDSRCDLNEQFSPDYLKAISANEKAALQDGACIHVNSSCIFNGTYWYSEPLRSPVVLHHHQLNRNGNRNRRQSYGSRTYPTAASGDTRYSATTPGYNYNPSYNNPTDYDSRPIPNPHYNKPFGPPSGTPNSPYGTNGNTNFGNNGNSGYNNNGNEYGGNGNNGIQNSNWNNNNQGGNSNGNGYSPNDRDSYTTNNQGNQNSFGNSESSKLGERGRAELQEDCRKQGRFTTVSLLPTTRFVFQPQPPRTRPRTKTLDDCKRVGWETTNPGTNDIFYETIVTEGNWWCNADIYVTISQAIFFVGAIVGGFLIGWIADTFGRVPALVIANIIGALGGILSTFTTNFYLFSFFRFLTGMSFDNCFVMMYILVLEFCGPTYRTLVANLSIAIFYTIGTVILPLLAVWLKDWRTFGRVIAAPMLLALVAMFVVPESSRWLLSKGKAKRATDILRRFAKVNRKQVDEKIFVDFEEDAQKLYDQISQEGPDPSLSEAFKTPRLRRTFILLVLIWSSIALVYDGHNRNILNLANNEWNFYWMFTFGSLTEFPADILLILTLDKFGRRWLAFFSLSLSGICSFIAATVPRDAWTATFVMAMMSRFWVNVAFNIGLQYASELLPTVIRAQGVNIIHIMGYVASLVSPLIAQIGRTQPVLSLLLLGAVSLFGGILALFLSETLGEELPNNLEEAEAFGKHQSFWNCPICAKPKPPEEERVVEVPEAVRLRNSLRASSRGEAYRSSIISNPNRPSRFGVALDPFPASEKPRLKRGYTR